MIIKRISQKLFQASQSNGKIIQKLLQNQITSEDSLNQVIFLRNQIHQFNQKEDCNEKSLIMELILTQNLIKQNLLEDSSQILSETSEIINLNYEKISILDSIFNVLQNQSLIKLNEKALDSFIKKGQSQLQILSIFGFSFNGNQLNRFIVQIKQLNKWDMQFDEFVYEIYRSTYRKFQLDQIIEALDLILHNGVDKSLSLTDEFLNYLEQNSNFVILPEICQLYVVTQKFKLNQKPLEEAINKIHKKHNLIHQNKCKNFLKVNQSQKQVFDNMKERLKNQEELYSKLIEIEQNIEYE